MIGQSRVARVIYTAEDRTGAATVSAARHLQRFGTEAGATSRILDNFGTVGSRALSKVGRFFTRQIAGLVRSFFYGIRLGAVGAGAAVAEFSFVAIKAFADFDKKLRETTSLIAGGNISSYRAKGFGFAKSVRMAKDDAQQAYAQYSKAVLAMAPGLRKTPQDLIGGLYEITSAGITKPGKSLALLRTGAMGASVGNAPTQEATRTLIQVMNALKIGGSAGQANKKQMMATMDKLFQAVNLGVGIEFGPLSRIIGQSVGQVGVSMGNRKDALDQMLGSIVVGSQHGLSYGQLGTGFSNALQKLFKPSKSAEKFAASIGASNLIGSQALSKFGFDNRNGVLWKLIDALKAHGFTGGKLESGLAKLFPDVRGIRLVSVLAQHKGDTIASVGSVAHSRGATSAGFAEQGKSFGARLETFKSMFEVAKIEFGHGLMPIVGKMMKTITDYMGSFNGGSIGAAKLADFAVYENQRYQSYRDRHPRENFTQFDRTFAPRLIQDFGGQLKGGNQRAFFAAAHWNNMRASSQIEALAKGAWKGFIHWWDKPSTQQMIMEGIHTAINKAFNLAGRALSQTPSVFNYGLKLVAEIEKGMWSGIKKGFSGTIKAILGGGSPFHGFSMGPFSSTNGKLGILNTLGITGLLYGGLSSRFKHPSANRLARASILTGGLMLGGTGLDVASTLGTIGFAGLKKKIPTRAELKDSRPYMYADTQVQDAKFAVKNFFRRTFGFEQLPHPSIGPELGASRLEAIAAYGSAAASSLSRSARGLSGADILKQVTMNAQVVYLNAKSMVGAGGVGGASTAAMAAEGAGGGGVGGRPGVAKVHEAPLTYEQRVSKLAILQNQIAGNNGGTLQALAEFQAADEAGAAGMSPEIRAAYLAGSGTMLDKYGNRVPFQRKFSIGNGIFGGRYGLEPREGYDLPKGMTQAQKAFAKTRSFTAALGGGGPGGPSMSRMEWLLANHPPKGIKYQDSEGMWRLDGKFTTPPTAPVAAEVRSPFSILMGEGAVTGASSAAAAADTGAVAGALGRSGVLGRVAGGIGSKATGLGEGIVGGMKGLGKGFLGGLKYFGKAKGIWKLLEKGLGGAALGGLVSLVIDHDPGRALATSGGALLGSLIDPWTLGGGSFLGAYAGNAVYDNFLGGNDARNKFLKEQARQQELPQRYGDLVGLFNYFGRNKNFRDVPRPGMTARQRARQHRRNINREAQYIAGSAGQGIGLGGAGFGLVLPGGDGGHKWSVLGAEVLALKYRKKDLGRAQKLLAQMAKMAGGDPGFQYSVGLLWKQYLQRWREHNFPKLGPDPGRANRAYGDKTHFKPTGPGSFAAGGRGRHIPKTPLPDARHGPAQPFRAPHQGPLVFPGFAPHALDHIYQAILNPHTDVSGMSKDEQHAVKLGRQARAAGLYGPSDLVSGRQRSTGRGRGAYTVGLFHPPVKNPHGLTGHQLAVLGQAEARNYLQGVDQKALDKYNAQVNNEAHRLAAFKRGANVTNAGADIVDRAGAIAGKPGPGLTLKQFTALWSPLDWSSLLKADDHKKVVDGMNRDYATAIRNVMHENGKLAPKNLALGIGDGTIAFGPMVKTYAQKMVLTAISATNAGLSRGLARTSGGAVGGGASSTIGGPPPRGAPEDPSLGFRESGKTFALSAGKHISQSVFASMMEGPFGGALKALSWLNKQVGKPYKMGGGHPPTLQGKAYDCSGLASSAMMAAGLHTSGTTFSLVSQLSPDGNPYIRLGFNKAKNPTHMGISVLGEWFEARNSATPILGPGKARTSWPMEGNPPKFHRGGVYKGPVAGGEGFALLRDEEMVVAPDGRGGLRGQKRQKGGGAISINIEQMIVRDDQDIQKIAERLNALLSQKMTNSAGHHG